MSDNDTLDQSEDDRPEDAFQEVLQMFESTEQFLSFASSCKGFNINQHQIKTLQENNPNDTVQLKWDIFALWRQSQEQATAASYRNLVADYLQNYPEAFKSAEPLQNQTELPSTSVTFKNSVKARLYVDGGRRLTIGKGKQNNVTETSSASENSSRPRNRTNVVFEGLVTVDTMVTNTEEVIVDPPDGGYLQMKNQDEVDMAEEHDRSGRTTIDNEMGNEECDKFDATKADDGTFHTAVQDKNEKEHSWRGLVTGIGSSKAIGIISFSAIAAILLTRAWK